MTADEFRQLVNSNTDADLLGPCLRDDFVPYVFAPKPDSWSAFRADLSSQLGTAIADIRVIGSGRFGFSLKPDTNLRGFSDRSDIDVVIVDATLFDEVWYALLQAAYPRPPVTEKMPRWVETRQREVYTGWISPLDIRLDKKIVGAKASPILAFNSRWFNIFKQASHHPPRRHEDITGRLYRSWRHAELYHLHSIAALRRSLSK